VTAYQEGGAAGSQASTRGQTWECCKEGRDKKVAGLFALAVVEFKPGKGNSKLAQRGTEHHN